MVSRIALLLSLLAAPSGAVSQTTSRAIAETADLSGLTASPASSGFISSTVERLGAWRRRIN